MCEKDKRNIYFYLVINALSDEKKNKTKECAQCLTLCLDYTVFEFL